MPLRVKCPTCHKEAVWENNPHRPICSDRCQMIDLGAWTEERCRVPAGELYSALDDQNDNNEDEPQ